MKYPKDILPLFNFPVLVNDCNKKNLKADNYDFLPIFGVPGYGSYLFFDMDPGSKKL